MNLYLNCKGVLYITTQPMKAGTTNENGDNTSNEEEEAEQILRHENSAASILCRLEALKSHGAIEALNLALTKDVLGIIGIVATLGKVNDDNLSRLLSEFLGLETMLAIVCRTYEAVQVLEKYDGDGTIISTAGIHGLGAAMGKSIKGRFVVICLEDLRKLALPKPQLPDGECPHGFLGYAVNMINLDRKNSVWVTRGGHGLRETLFYSLFSRVQVYKTRDEMIHALPCIHDGALSLDGVFILGTRDQISCDLWRI